MGYRTFQTEPHPKRRNMQVTTTPGKVYVHNGCTADLAIPCFYQEAHEAQRVRLHNRAMHDHMGWPDPMRKDRSCQIYEPMEAGWHEPDHTVMGGHPITHRYVDGTKLVPIHLKEEYPKSTSSTLLGGPSTYTTSHGVILHQSPSILLIVHDDF